MCTYCPQLTAPWSSKSFSFTWFLHGYGACASSSASSACFTREAPMWNCLFLPWICLISLVCKVQAMKPQRVKRCFPPRQSRNKDKMLTAATDETQEKSGLWDSIGRFASADCEENRQRALSKEIRTCLPFDHWRCLTIYPKLQIGTKHSGQRCSQMKDQGHPRHWQYQHSCLAFRSYGEMLTLGEKHKNRAQRSTVWTRQDTDTMVEKNP